MFNRLSQFYNLTRSALHSLACASVLVTGCSIAPVTPQPNANTVEKGKFAGSAWIAPVLTARAAYGVTDRLTIGADVEQFNQTSFWSKYSFINGQTLAWSGSAGAFVGPSTNKARGLFADTTLNKQLSSSVNVFANYRHTKSNYTPVDPDDDNLTDNELWWGIDSRDSKDLSNTSQLNIGLSFRLGLRGKIHLGYGCQHHHRNNDPLIDTNPCAPLIGLSVN